MPLYKITYTDSNEDEVEAERHRDVGSFIDFETSYFEETPRVPGVTIFPEKKWKQVLRVRADQVRRIERVRD